MKNLIGGNNKREGRNAQGRVTVRHRGGGVKRFLRVIDYKRDKLDVWGKVVAIEYDPNRQAKIALLVYQDGDKRYVLAPFGLVLGQKVIASADAPLEPGNALPLKSIPAGTQVHNLEIKVGHGGQMVRGAGNAAVVQGKEGDFVLVRLPSGELRRFNPDGYATIGQIGNPEARTHNWKKGGARRRKGIRPTVRGVAMHPNAHPHGGGEGRSSVGLKFPKTPWGKPAVGKTRDRKRYSRYLIVEPRKKGKHS
jgi:large subunit ribosomal protein L2